MENYVMQIGGWKWKFIFEDRNKIGLGFFLKDFDGNDFFVCLFKVIIS